MSQNHLIMYVFLNFDLDNITKKELYEGGYEAAREFIEK